MSTPLGIGNLSVPKLLPVTGTFALPFTAYYLLLSARVVAHRLSSKQWMGEKTSGTTDRPDALFHDSRAHANFAENVPLAFILATVLELNGANRKTLSYVMGAFFALRVMHCELGIRASGKEGAAMGPGRAPGYFGTVGVLAGLAGWGAWIVKGYWGL